MRAIATLICLAAFAADAAESRFITTKGEATVQVPPDFIEIEMEILAIGADSTALKHDVDSRTEQVLIAASKLGVAGTDIESGGVSVEREYEIDRNDNETLRGYNVNRSVTVKLRDISKYEEFVHALVDAKVDSIGSVEVDVNDPSALNQRALVQAARNARNEANAIAAELGLQLGAPFEVSEDQLWTRKGLRERGDNLEETIVTAQKRSHDSQAPITKLVLQPHAIEAEATVWARFEIAPRAAP